MDVSPVLSTNVKMEAEDMPAVMTTNDFDFDVDDEDNLSMIDFSDANDLLGDDELNNIQPAAQHENLPEMTMKMPPEKQAERRTSIDFAREILWSSSSSSADAVGAVDDDVMPMAVPSSSCSPLAMADDAAQHEHEMDLSNSSIGVNSYHTASSASSFSSGSSSFHHRRNDRSLSLPRKRIKNEEPSSMQHDLMNNSISGLGNAGETFDARHQRRQQQQEQQQQQAAQYNDLLAKLAECMKRSEQSRAEIMRHQQKCASSATTANTDTGGASRAYHRQPVRVSSSASSCIIPSFVTSSARLSPQQQRLQQQQMQHLQQQQRQRQQQQPLITQSLAGFLSGSQSTLTVGLEQSRRQLAAYVARMGPNQTL